MKKVLLKIIKSIKSKKNILWISAVFFVFAFPFLWTDNSNYQFFNSQTEDSKQSIRENDHSAIKQKNENDVVLWDNDDNINEIELFLVTKIVDGDTIDVNIYGKTERVRLIGVDTPETVDPRRPVECFGKEAFLKTKEMLLDKKIYLKSDITQSDRDKYGRLLRYIFLEDGTNYNLWLINNGYAYEYTHLLPYKYQSDFKSAQKEAQGNLIGLWSPQICGNNLSNIQNRDCLIKGNINVATKEKIYHLPDQKYYNSTIINEENGEQWFCSEGEAQAAGWRKSQI